MNINGVNILEQSILYKPTWYGVIGWIVFIFTAIIFIADFVEQLSIVKGLIGLALLTLFILDLMFTFGAESPTILNQPDKIQYTIEILDDNAWKELGPHYSVKEKVYENKEIYIIEGDYNNANSN